MTGTYKELKVEQKFKNLPNGTGKVYCGDKSSENTLKSNEANEGFISIGGLETKVIFDPEDFGILALDSKTESPKKLIKLCELDTEGLKFDQEKPIAGALKDFDLALMELSKLLSLGAKKYERSSWKNVPNAEQRYYDGLWRHLLEFDDVEGDLGHDVAVVFNALAVLQLRLMREQNEKY